MGLPADRTGHGVSGSLTEDELGINDAWTQFPTAGGPVTVPAMPAPETDFLTAWRALPRADRLRIRRLVRLGRPLASREESQLAAGYAAFQRSRIWFRLFWLWFVPGLFLALGVATQIHPLMIGVVLAFAAQAVYTHRNLGRVEAVNAAVV
jgi:hypothetical protein